MATTEYKERLKLSADILIAHSLTDWSPEYGAIFIDLYQLELKNGDNSVLMEISKDQFNVIAAVIENHNRENKDSDKEEV